MHALPVILESTASYPLLRHPTTAVSALLPPTVLCPSCNNFFLYSSPSSKPFVSSHRTLNCLLSGDSTPLDHSDDDFSIDYDDDDYAGDFLLDDKADSLSDNGVFIEIKKLGRNSRRIRSKIGVDASLDAVWSILTDYEKLADFIPGLAVSELVEKNGNRARLYQIGQQNLPLGLKFNAKGVLDCYEKELEILPSGKRREIEFKMVEGDFQLFEGKWSIEQFNKGNCGAVAESPLKEFQTSLSYLVDVKPKLWLPVRLVEGRLCNEIKTNLSCIRREAQKIIESALQDL